MIENAPSVGSDATNHTDVTQPPAPGGNAGETGTQSREDLRQRYAEALHAGGFCELVFTGSLEAGAAAHCRGDCNIIADAVLAVRDEELNANRTMAWFRHRQAVAERDRAEAAEAEVERLRSIVSRIDAELSRVNYLDQEVDYHRQRAETAETETAQLREDTRAEIRNTESTCRHRVEAARARESIAYSEREQAVVRAEAAEAKLAKIRAQAQIGDGNFVLKAEVIGIVDGDQ